MILTVASQKGGATKSTTVQAIVTGTTRKALAIDLDPQANLTFTMEGNPLDRSALDVLTGEAKAVQVIQHTDQGDVLPAGRDLYTADTVLTGDARVYALKTALKAISRRYDLIVIDTPPNLSTLTLNALAAADAVLIPVQAEILALQGLLELIQTVKQVRRDYNPKLKFAGILFTRYNTRTNVSKVLTDEITERAAAEHVPVLDVKIPEGVAVKESQIMRQSIFQYAPRSKPAEAYRELLKELDLV